jgi:23S rRNA pseudouridine955/2504/2580 synthase
MNSPSLNSGVKIIKVPEDRDGQRLDNFLLGLLKGAPRSLIYKIIRDGQVRINGKRAKPEDRLDEGDDIRVPPVKIEQPDPNRVPPKAMLERLQASIVFEDKALLVINKPSGIATHGGSGISFGIIEGFRALRPNEPLELVHRLDRETSGVLVLAKKRSALLQLQALMRKQDDDEGPEKQYLALLVGRMPSGTMTVKAALQKSVMQGGERMVRVDLDGKPSISHFTLLERRGGYSLCKIRIETGRTHQIRVHAAHIGHPVAGDDKYGDKEANKKLSSQFGLKRLFLHAESMQFAINDGQTPYNLTAPLASELNEVLNKLVGE